MSRGHQVSLERAHQMLGACGPPEQRPYDNDRGVVICSRKVISDGFSYAILKEQAVVITEHRVAQRRLYATLVVHTAKMRLRIPSRVSVGSRSRIHQPPSAGSCSSSPRARRPAPEGAER